MGSRKPPDGVSTSLNFFLSLMVIGAVSSSCATAPKGGSTLVATEMMEMVAEDGSRRALSAGESVAFEGEFARFEAPDRTPLLLIQSTPENRSYRVSLKPSAAIECVGEGEKKVADLDSAILHVLNALDDLKGGKLDVANRKIDALVQQHPKVAAGYFLRAQLQILDGNRTGAIESLKTALTLRKEFQEARMLLDNLEKGRQ